jgi:branched-chain amino acid aminotransferase
MTRTFSLTQRISSLLKGSTLQKFSAAPFSALAALDASRLMVHHTTVPKEKSPEESLVFGATFTDHMLVAEWDDVSGWHAPEIKPFQNLSLHPGCNVLHYGLECFEGMKAYKDKEGNVRLFRPEMNMNRLNRSSARLCLPDFDGHSYLDCIKELVLTDADWIPTSRGYSMYIRPTMIGTHEWLGVGPARKAMLFTICCPVGPYYKEGFAPVSLFAEERYARAFPGGTGDVKAGGNYGPTILPQVECSRRGYSQVLWLAGPEHYVTEVGTMNLFMLWENEQGKKELITAPLDGTILPGVTRDSILQLCKEWSEFDVVERYFTMDELVKALHEERVHEMFGAGTAAIVSPVKQIAYHGHDYAIPLNKNDASAKAGELTTRLLNTILDIQYGDMPHPWSVNISGKERTGTIYKPVS